MRGVEWRSCLPRYKTVRRAAITDWRLSLLYLSIVGAIVLYVLIYTIILQRGYQVSAPMSGNSRVSVVGAAINTGGTPWTNESFPADMFQYYDSTDLVIPAFEHQATTIITNLWETHGQTRGRCYPGSNVWSDSLRRSCCAGHVELRLTDSFCLFPALRWNAVFPDTTAASDCASKCVRGTVEQFSVTTSQGVWTGEYRLANASDLYPADPRMVGQQLCYCELNTWCPDEYIDPDPPNPFHLINVDAFTVNVRTVAQFHQFGVSTIVTDRWAVADILARGGYSYEQVRQKGVDLLMSFEWNCDVVKLDSCRPTLTVDTLIPTFTFHMAEVTQSSNTHRGAGATLFGSSSCLISFRVLVTVVCSCVPVYKRGQWSPLCAQPQQAVRDSTGD